MAMSPEEFKVRMEQIVAHDWASGSEYQSPDVVHSNADDLLCELLRSLGYGDGIAVYESLARYFA